MLKNFFISMLGTIAGFWISLMLLVLVGVAVAVGSIASAFVNSETTVKVEKGSVLVINLDSMIEERASTRGLQQILNDSPDTQTLVNLVRAINTASRASISNVTVRHPDSLPARHF